MAGPTGAMAAMPCVFPVMRPKGARRAILCVHPGGLSSKNYALLADRFPGHALYVAELSFIMRYVEASDARVPADGLITEIAEQVRTGFEAASQEPLSILCGWSFGGVIAHEIALRLAEEGKREPHLMVIDSIAPVDKYRFDWVAPSLSAKGLAARAGEAASLVPWFVQYLNALKGCALPKPTRKLWSLPDEILVERLLAQAVAAGAFPKDTSPAGFGKIFREFRRGMTRNTRLLAMYTPDGPKRDVLLVRASSPFFPIFRLFRAMGWDALASDLTIRTVAGDHYELISDPQRMARIAELLHAHVEKQNERAPAYGANNLELAIGSE